MAKSVQLHEAAVEKIKAVSKTGHFSAFCLFQAMPVFYGKLSDTNGGSSLDLEQHLKDWVAISMLFSINVSEPEIVDYGLEVAHQYLKDGDDFTKSVGGCIDWTYLNYADQK
ncbi:hypothetical protein BJ878DRAFT_290154 [Calycina marina]|uniref:Uncharacterized protein n=1 Tax=Calycina marina TaxID=1763456 RepID=A0A9P7YWD8_9HELO|nr:hypothetical protein BJ878DRAFT_290154 [Calycina marina]